MAALRDGRGSPITPHESGGSIAPVVSVGSLSAGGSGKTPLAAFVARRLLEAGHRPAILSRGYARTAPDDGVTIVSDGTRLRADLGRRRRRATDAGAHVARRAGGRLARSLSWPAVLAELHLGATVHVLDDGFQHLVLARDVDLLIVDAADVDRPRCCRRAACASRWRGRASRRCDPRLGRRQRRASDRRRALGVEDAFTLTRDGWRSRLKRRRRRSRAAWTRRHGSLLVSGIARPARFEEDARAPGLDIAGAMVFRDHHRLRTAEIARSRSCARQRRRHGGHHREGPGPAARPPAMALPPGDRAAAGRGRAARSSSQPGCRRDWRTLERAERPAS